MKIMSILLAPFPGLTQIYLGRYLRGILFFFGFVILLDLGLVIIPCLLLAVPSNPASNGFYLGAGVFWCYHVGDIIRIIWWRERKDLREKKNLLFQDALALYLQDKLDAAQTAFRKILKIDRDDPDALFYLGKIYQAAGKKYQAKYLFQKSLNLDPREKWRWVIQEEIK